jgi:hypothetical protein
MAVGYLLFLQEQIKGIIIIGVLECAPGSPYIHILFATHRFADERTPTEATPLSATSGKLSSGLDLGLGLGSHSSSHAPSLLVRVTRSQATKVSRARGGKSLKQRGSAAPGSRAPAHGGFGFPPPPPSRTAHRVLRKGSS